MNEFNELRHECGFTKCGAARFLSVSTSSVNKWCSGSRECPESVLGEMRAFSRVINQTKYENERKRNNET